MEWLIIILLGMGCWWLWAERGHYKELYEDSFCNKPKEIPKGTSKKDFVVEYDDKIPHPFK